MAFFLTGGLPWSVSAALPPRSPGFIPVGNKPPSMTPVQSSPSLYLFILDTMSDWEAGYLLSELGSGRFFINPSERYTLRLCGQTPDAVKTMGGMHLTPEILIDEIEPAPGDLLVLPGGNTWLDPARKPVITVVEELMSTGILIGAICGATMGLANAGLLNTRPHTSNDPEVLKMFCPGYSGGDWYVHEPAVTDGNLITASGLAPVAFTYQILKKLGVMRESTVNAWYQLNRTGEPEWFYALMESMKS